MDGTDMSTEHESSTADQRDGTSQHNVQHRPDEHRFVLSRGGEDLAHLEYVIRDGVWLMTHTFTEPAARGHGLAAEVTTAALDGARSAGVRVRAICPYVAAYVAEHPAYQDLLRSPGAG
jgi:predicted GNAT family acetyltransferase